MSTTNLHPWDEPRRKAARALLDDVSPYWRRAALEALIEGVEQNKAPDAILEEMLTRVAEYDRYNDPIRPHLAVMRPGGGGAS